MSSSECSVLFASELQTTFSRSSGADCDCELGQKIPDFKSRHGDNAVTPYSALETTHMGLLHGDESTREVYEVYVSIRD